MLYAWILVSGLCRSRLFLCITSGLCGSRLFDALIADCVFYGIKLFCAFIDSGLHESRLCFIY